jgi:hypothetical protein
MRVHVFSMSMIAEINTTIGSYKLTTNLRTIVYHYEEENRYNYFLNIITEILSCIYGSIQTRNLYARYTTEDITKGPWKDNTQHGDILMCREQGLSPGGSGRPASSRASWGQARLAIATTGSLCDLANAVAYFCELPNARQPDVDLAQRGLAGGNECAATCSQRRGRDLTGTAV